MRAYKDARAELGPSRQMAKEVNAEFQRVDRDTTAAWKDGRPAQAILDRYKAAKKESEEAFAYAAKVDDYVAKLGAAVRKGVFHPIRSSADYDSDRAGDAIGRSRKTRSAKKRKLKAKAGATARHKAGLR